jgi:hypothetical protein
MFEFKIKKMSLLAITRGQGRATGDTGSISNVLLNCFAINIKRKEEHEY